MTEAFNLLFISAITATVTWLSARRKNNAEAKTSELDNVGKAITIWRELSEDMEIRFREEIDKLKKDNCDLQHRVSLMMKENEELKSQMNALEVENRKLISQLKIFNKNNQS
jgi:predicted RNase H-like nuclease (RuvC/YqgF family)